MIRPALLAGCLLWVGGAAAAPPTGRTPLPCAGAFTTYRISDIKPGMMSLFEQAVRDHNAYYARHQVPSHIALAEILELTPEPHFSTTAIMTVATYNDPKAQAAMPHDDGYAKFVAEYQQSSTMRSETLTCLLPAS